MARTITIYNSTTQRKQVVENVEANTLGELKAVLANHGISLGDMSILEGVSNTQLLSDESQLPTNIRYRDSITNDLMLYLTPKKNVASGADKAVLVEGINDVIEGLNKIGVYCDELPDPCPCGQENPEDSGKGFSMTEIAAMRDRFYNPKNETPENLEENKQKAFFEMCKKFFGGNACEE